MVVEDDAARAAKARDIGLFRYPLIREAADRGLTAKQRGQLVRELAEQEHVGPDGRPVRVSRWTLDRWIRWWHAGGFDALVPKPRNVTPRTDPAMLSLAAALKKENPRRTAAQIHRIMQTASGGSPVPAVRTIQAHLSRLGLSKITDGSPVFGRFEAEHANDRWTGDVLHGPPVAGARTMLFAWIDDHTRMLVGWRWVRREDTIRAQSVLRAAITAHGVPKSCYLDNGSPFVDGQFKRALAILGVRLIHSRPGQPQGRGKIERFFRTVRDGFLVEYAGGNLPESMDSINEAFTAWVEQVYHQRVHTETGQSPQMRWQTSWDAAEAGPAYADGLKLHDAFQWAARRQVSKTATISFEGNQYEVDPALIGCEIELIYDPFDLADITVRYRGRDFGKATPFTVNTHVHRKARPDETQPVVVATGIDYLAALTDLHEQAATGIAFADLIGTTSGSAEREHHDAEPRDAEQQDVDVVDGLLQPALFRQVAA